MQLFRVGLLLSLIHIFSVDYLKKLFAKYGVIVSAKPEQHRLLQIVNETFDLGLEMPQELKLFQLSEQHRRLVAVSYTHLDVYKRQV